VDGIRIGISDGGIDLTELLAPPVGVWTATLYDGDKVYNDHGRCLTPVLWSLSKTNLITTIGKGQILDRLLPVASVPLQLNGLAVGTSATAAAVGDSAITGAVYKAWAATPVRAALVATGTVSYTTAEANIAIAEAGGLSAAAGLLFNRVAPFLSFTKTASFALDLTLSLTQS
jgi:hypothetical protein